MEPARQLRPAPAAAGRGTCRCSPAAADFWTDPSHTQPLQAALMAGEFAVHLRDGDVYSVDEIRSWLAEAEWRFVECTPLAGPQSLVIAVAE